VGFVGFWEATKDIFLRTSRHILSIFKFSNFGFSYWVFSSFRNLDFYIEYFQSLDATQNPTEPNLKGMVVCQLYRKIKLWAFDMGNCVPHSQISQKNGLSCLDQFLSQKKKLWSNSHCVNYWKLCFYYLNWSMFRSIYRAGKIHFCHISHVGLYVSLGHFWKINLFSWKNLTRFE